MLKKCLYCKKEFNICHSKIKLNWGKYCSLNCRILSKRGEISKTNCGYCHKVFKDYKCRKRKYCCEKCFNLSKIGKSAWNKGIECSKGKNANNWKGGIIFDSFGYKYIFSPNHPNYSNGHPYIAEHRLIAEEYLGRTLEKYEVVHHINGDNQDNRPENLYVFPNQRYHAKFHKFFYQLTSNII